MTAPLTSNTPSDLTVAQAGELLALAPYRVRHLIRTGELPAYDISASARRGHTGHRPTYRIPAKAITDFRRSRMVNTHGGTP